MCFYDQQAFNASHFAPTGKNPESSRGHVAIVAKLTQLVDATPLESYFVCVDLGMYYLVSYEKNYSK